MIVHQFPVRALSERRSLNYSCGYLLIRHFRACLIAVLMIAAFNAFFRLGSTNICPSDEARYGVSAFEMLEKKDFIVTTYAGEREYWNLKPPMGYWFISSSFYLFGPTVFALRLPSALAFIFCVWLTMLFVKEHYGRRQAILAGLILSSASGLLSNHGARSGDLDGILTCILTLVLFLAARSNKSFWRAFWVALCFGAGFLIKSFAIIPQLAALLVWVIWCGTWRKASWWKIAGSLLIFSAMIGWWVLARYQADHSHAFVLQMITEDLFDRSTKPIDGNNPDWYYYVGQILDRFAPWSELVLLATLLLVNSMSATRTWLLSTTNRLLLLWIAVPFILFTCSQTKHHWYMDPLYPPLAALSAIIIIELLRRLKKWRSGSLVFLLALVVACEFRVMYRIVDRERRPPAQEFLVSLHKWKTNDNTSIHTLCRIYHAEQFILQVVNKFTLLPVDPAQRTLSLLPGSMLLIEKDVAPLPPVLEHGGVILDEGAGYTLMRAF